LGFTSSFVPISGWCACGCIVLFFSGGTLQHRRCSSGCQVRARRGLAGLPLLPPLLLFLLLLGVPGEEEGREVRKKA
jgi:hypothetical protein